MLVAVGKSWTYVGGVHELDGICDWLLASKARSRQDRWSMSFARPPPGSHAWGLTVAEMKRG